MAKEELSKLVFHDFSQQQFWPNKPSAPNAGMASRLTIEGRWPGVAEPER